MIRRRSNVSTGCECDDGVFLKLNNCTVELLPVAHSKFAKLRNRVQKTQLQNFKTGASGLVQTANQILNVTAKKEIYFQTGKANRIDFGGFRHAGRIDIEGV